MKKIFIILSICIVVSISIFGQNNEVKINECWALRVCDSIFGCYEVKYYFHDNGEFEATYHDRNTRESIKKKKVKLFEKGTYHFNAYEEHMGFHYGDMFLSISASNYFNKKKKYSVPIRKRFFLIIPLDQKGKDKTDIDHNVVYYDDWEINDGVYKGKRGFVGKILLGSLKREPLGNK